MKRTLFIISCFLPVLLTAQISMPAQFFKGYERSVKGGGFQYHSPQPDVSSSLLIRSIDSVQFIEWETETIPAGFLGESVKFVWMFGIDANTDSHTFRLYINGSYCLTFANPVLSDRRPWTVRGALGCELLFRPVMIDKYGDPMGYAVLTVPSSMVIENKQQRIRISGKTKESRSWYMTFEAGVEENLAVSQVPALVKGESGNSIPVLFRFIHLGEAINGELEIRGCQKSEFTLETGFNEIRVLVPENLPPGIHTALITIFGNEPYTHEFTVSPIRHFTIYLVQHTHTDIGYTRPQTEILPDHLRYIDYALDFCDQTDHLPDHARFRWTCETSWAVREYLRTRPASQIERLKRRVNEGRIELTGLFTNSSDLADEAIISATLQPVAEMRASGFPVKSAMQSDINGIPWCLADYLPAAGIEFLNMAQNTHRAAKPFGLPTTFWWESPAGNRLMVNRSEHYMAGNSMGILGGVEPFAKGLFQHLHEISLKGYPYDHYAIQFSGYLTDNSPPSTGACKMVQEWNDRYIWPKLRLATISEFMSYMKKEHSGDLPVIRGAWPDWWMDGFGSAAIQTAYARKAHCDYIANGGLMSMAAIMGASPNSHITELQRQVTDDIAFYDEHTFGAAESITDPLCENSVVQLGQKESFVWSAVKKNHILREMVMGQIQPFIPRPQVPSIVVFNTLNWSRNGYVPVYVDYQLLPGDRQFRILDFDGTVMPMQPVSRHAEGSWWLLYVKEVPPLGYRIYRIQTTAEPADVPRETAFKGILENEFYRLELDAGTGRITGLYDKVWRKSLLDPAARYSLGEFIYERLGKNRGQLEQYKLEEFTRETWENIMVSDVKTGPLWQWFTLTGQKAACADPSGIRCEIRLYHHEKKVEFSYSMKKLAVYDPEGVYIAFPFALDNSRHVVEVAGGAMVPGKEQIEGSASDWQGIQNFVSLRSDSGQILFASPEIPLVQLGNLNLGNFSRFNEPSGGNIYSWVLNNYWTTNFLASQQGELKWTYQISSGADPSNTPATRFGMEHRVPFLSRVFPGSADPDSVLIPRSFFASAAGSLVLVSARPALSTNGIVLQMRETSGRPDSIPVYDLVLSSVTLAMGTQAKTVSEVNVLEEPVKLRWKTHSEKPEEYHPVRIAFKPFETKFILIGL